MRWCVYEPRLGQEANVGDANSFGANARVLPKLDRADVILALDSDFLDCGQGDLETVRGFTSRRRVNASKDSMNRLYVVEHRFTLTARWRIIGCVVQPVRFPHSRMRSRRKFSRERMIPVWALCLEISKARQTLSTSNGLMGLPLI
jgi:hypothetical protein